jgi:hypothetical protein
MTIIFDGTTGIAGAGSVTGMTVANTAISGTLTNAQLPTTISATIVPTNSFSYRNKFINGNFDIWQRATSGTPAAIWAYVSADRWGGHCDGTAGTYSRDTAVPNSLSTYSMKMTGTSGGTNAYLDQRIEASELRELINAGSVTISGWVRRNGSAASAISVNLITPTATDNFASYNTIGACFTQNNYISGDGTATGSSLTLTTAGTWYYFKVTDTSFNTSARTGLANGAQIYFAVGGLGSTSNGYNFAQLQIEAGPNATPFEQRSIGTELALCQRYYEAFTTEVYDTSGIPSGDKYWYWLFKVTKRATPTFTYTAGANLSALTGDANTGKYYGAGASYIRIDNGQASAEL